MVDTDIDVVMRASFTNKNKRAIQKVAVPTPCPLSTLKSRVWAKLHATPFRTEFGGLDTPVTWAEADCQILLYDKTGTEVTIDPVDVAALHGAQPLHAFELFTVLPAGLSLYRRILPVEETSPAVRANDQNQPWTKCSPVHLASMCDVSQLVGGVSMDGSVFPSIRIFPFDTEAVYGASLQCQKAATQSDPETIKGDQEKWTFCDPDVTLKTPAPALSGGVDDPFGLLHSPSLLDPDDLTHRKIPGIHRRPPSNPGSLDRDKKKDKMKRLEEMVKVKHYFYFELIGGTNLGAVGGAVIFDNLKHGHWTLVPYPLVSPPPAAPKQWLPNTAGLWTTNLSTLYERNGAGGGPAHPEFEVVRVANQARLVLPAVAGLFKLHSMHMEASGEVCELLARESPGDDVLLAALSAIESDGVSKESEQVDAIEAAVLVWSGLDGDRDMTVSEARTFLDAAEVAGCPEAMSDVEEMLVSVVERDHQVQQKALYLYGDEDIPRVTVHNGSGGTAKIDEKSPASGSSAVAMDPSLPSGHGSDSPAHGTAHPALWELTEVSAKIISWLGQISNETALHNILECDLDDCWTELTRVRNTNEPSRFEAVAPLMCEVGSQSVGVTLHGEIEEGVARNLLKDNDFVLLVLRIATLLLYCKDGQRKPRVNSLVVRATGVSSVPWNPDRPAMLEQPSPLDSSNTFMRFYLTDCTAGHRGRRVAEQIYNILRFLQTQDYGTGHKFLVLFSSPGGLPIEFKMLPVKNWRRSVSRDVLADPLIADNFYVERQYESFEKPAKIRSTSHGIFLFMAWDKTFFGKIRRDHLEKYIFKRHAIGYEDFGVMSTYKPV